MEEKDYLKDFIKDNESPGTATPEHNDNIEMIGNNVRQKVDYIKTSVEEQYHNIDIEHLPYHKFYPLGTKIFIRAARTKEIEAFSVVNEQNHYDRHVKMIEMLKACVRIQYMDGSYGSYTDLIYDDRDVLIILISRLTSKNGRKIAKKIKCDCGTETNLEFIPVNYIYNEENEKIKKYFNNEKRQYDFPLKSGAIVSLRPPTVGLVESLNKYIFYHTLKSQQDNPDGNVTYKPNVSFMNNITYLKSGEGVKELDIKEWEQIEYEYERINKELFMFVDDAIKMIDMSIKRVESKCSSETCNKKISTPLHYPDGLRALFIVPNAFDEFIQ